MPTWNGKESQREKATRLRKERRAEVLQASAEALEEIDRVLGDSCMAVITPIHPVKEHYHGDEDPDPPILPEAA